MLSGCFFVTYLMRCMMYLRSFYPSQVKKSQHKSYATTKRFGIRYTLQKYLYIKPNDRLVFLNFLPKINSHNKIYCNFNSKQLLSIKHSWLYTTYDYRSISYGPPHCLKTNKQPTTFRLMWPARIDIPNWSYKSHPWEKSHSTLEKSRITYTQYFPHICIQPK